MGLGSISLWVKFDFVGMIFHIYSPRFFHWIEIGARKPAAWKMLSMSNIPSINWQVFICRKAIQVPMFMLDGGLFGGRVHTVWYFRRQLFSIKSISVCIRMRCQPQSENLQPKTGFLSPWLIYIEHIVYHFLPWLLNCIAHVFSFSPEYWYWSTRNCEDIAMSFLVANVTGSPPIWVKGKWYIWTKLCTSLISFSHPVLFV